MTLPPVTVTGADGFTTAALQAAAGLGALTVSGADGFTVGLLKVGPAVTLHGTDGFTSGPLKAALPPTVVTGTGGVTSGPLKTALPPTPVTGVDGFTAAPLQAAAGLGALTVSGADGFTTGHLTIPVNLGPVTLSGRGVLLTDGAREFPPVTLSGAGTLTAAQMGHQGFLTATLGGDGGVEAWLPAVRTVAPSQGAEPFRLVVCDVWGERYAELDGATLGPVSWLLNDTGEMTFTLPLDDPKIDEVHPVTREVQLWRGRQPRWWGVLTKARATDQTCNFTANTLDWYLSRVHVGKVPLPNLLSNGGFESGNLRPWLPGWDTGSIPAAAPATRIVRTPALNGGRSLRMQGSDKTTTSQTTLAADVTFPEESYTISTAGKAEIRRLVKRTPGAAPHFTVYGHTDNQGSYESSMPLSVNRANAVADFIKKVNPAATVTAVGRGEDYPVASNTTAAGRAANRRVEILHTVTQTATGHRQYVQQTIRYTNPVAARKAKTLTLAGHVYITEFRGASHDGWGLYLERARTDGSHSRYAYASLTADTPLERWVEMTAQVAIPADGHEYVVTARLYPPNGTCYWDQVALTATDALAFLDVDQSDIIKGLVEHAQDPTLGKGDYRLGTRTPKTGVKRTREYPWVERAQIREAMRELPTLAGGLDWDVEFTETTRTVTTYFPRKGRVHRNLVLAWGSNIQDFTLDADGDQQASQVIVQADGEGTNRPEGVARSRDLFDGLVLERVYAATPGSAVSSLQPQADRGLGRYQHPVVIPSITVTDDDVPLGTINPGDIVTVSIDKGWIQFHGQVRVTGVSLDPASALITYSVTPWDKWSV